MRFLLLCLLLVACSEKSSPPTSTSDDDTSSIDPTKLTYNCFNADARNPLLKRNVPFLGATWNDPKVIKMSESEYYLYASSDHDDDANNTLDQNIKIYRWKSTNGLDWTLDPQVPVFEKSSSATAFDRKGVETPSIVYFNNKFHLFYLGYPLNGTNSLEYRIGHAVSDDGIQFTRSDNFLLGPSGTAGSFNEYVTSEPGAVVYNNQIYLYFTAVGINTSVADVFQVIGLVKSSDGNNWSTPKQVLAPSQTIYPRASHWYGYTTPEAIVLSDGVHLFFSVAYAEAADDSDWHMRNIHHAKSADGETGWIEDAQPIFKKETFSWASREIRSPAPYLVGTNLMLLFGGDDFFNQGTFGIGLATCSLLADSGS